MDDYSEFLNRQVTCPLSWLVFLAHCPDLEIWIWIYSEMIYCAYDQIVDLAEMRRIWEKINKEISSI